MPDHTRRGRGASALDDLDLEGDRALLAAALVAEATPELPALEPILAAATARRRARSVARRRATSTAVVALGLAAAALVYARPPDRERAVARPDPAAAPATTVAPASAGSDAPGPRAAAADDEPTCTPYERRPAPMSECPALASGRCELDERR